MTTATIEPIHCVRWPDGRVELLTAPPLSSITPGALIDLERTWRDPDDDDVLVFPGDVRYLLGDEVPDSNGCRYLHRLP